MKRSFIATAFMVAVFAFASTANAQISFLLDGFTSSSGLTSPNWSVTVQLNTGTATSTVLEMGQFRFDDPQPLANGVQLPITAPFASADADFLTGFGTATYTTRLISLPIDVSGFAGGIVGLAPVAVQTHDTGNVDNPSAFSLHQSLGEYLAGIECALQIDGHDGRQKKSVSPVDPGT